MTDPVQLDKKEYKIGEPITGFFEGERYSNKPAIFNRTLVCADFRAILKPVRVESPPIGVFNRGAILLTLNNHIFAIENIPVTAQKSCEIIYAPQTVMRKYPLGGEELQQDQAFRTTTFDIVVE